VPKGPKPLRRIPEREPALLDPRELADITQRDAVVLSVSNFGPTGCAVRDRRVLLNHIDALTAKRKGRTA
jgi:hypothetical protein